jgi:hypothetical protein
VSTPEPHVGGYHGQVSSYPYNYYSSADADTYSNRTWYTSASNLSYSTYVYAMAVCIKHI